jgi:segregation and condensation protein B
MSLKAKVEAIIYAAEEPVTLEQISVLLKDVVLADLASAKENAAIGKADDAAEALAAQSEDAASEESTLLPELAADPAADPDETLCPESGPLMPEEGAQSAISEEPASEITPELTEPTAEAVPAATDADASPAEPAAGDSAAVAAPDTTSRKRQPKKSEQEIAEDKAVRARVREVLVELVTDYASEDRGMEIRQVAGGFRMATKPEHHDVVRAFAKSLKPPIRLSLAALETLAVVAYKQPVTGPEISDIRGVESGSVLGTLLDRKLITTAGRKQVIGRPMQYKTSKDFLLRFGLNNVNELPSMEEFSQLASDGTIEITASEPQETPSLFEPEAQPEPENLEANESESSTPEPQPTAELQESDATQPPDAAEAAASQPQPDDESSNIPEAEHPIGQQ